MNVRTLILTIVFFTAAGLSYGIDDSYWISIFSKLERHELAQANNQYLSIPSNLVVSLFETSRKFHLPPTDPYGDDEYGWDWYGDIRLSTNSPVFHILSHPNGQNFSMYRLYASPTLKFEIAESTFVPGNGSVYTFKRLSTTQEIFVPIKGIFEEKWITEIPQPLYAFEREGRANTDIDLFSDRVLSKPTFHVPKGEKVTVVGLADGDDGYRYALIVTAGGLSGWHKVFVVSTSMTKTEYSISVLDGAN